MAAAALTGPADAMALPDCPTLPTVRTLLTNQGRLESIVGDERGRLYYTDLSNDRLLRLDGPGQQPKVLATNMARPGGLAFDSDGGLIVGFSGGAASGVPGNGMAGIFHVDRNTGAKRVFISGIDQANGLARAHDGTLYTSNDIDGEIVRVGPTGSVTRHWADVDSANGVVIDRSERFLFAAQTFTPAKIARIEIAHPTNATTFFAASPQDFAAGLDGITRDGAGRLYVAANGSGEVWRVGTDAHACALARGLMLTSSVGFGGGGAFDRHNLYAVSFQGRVVELAGVTDTPPEVSPQGRRPARKPHLSIVVRPRHALPGRTTRFRFTVTSKGHPVSGVRVRLGGRATLTDVRGKAQLVVRFDNPGVKYVHSSRAGYVGTRAAVRVRREPEEE
jgi:sugar lactone lactonase YvrE